MVGRLLAPLKATVSWVCIYMYIYTQAQTEFATIELLSYYTCLQGNVNCSDSADALKN